ncbi:protachykinin-1, partial [Geospiza fortis]|uniref:Protachykinin-1 n=1 Tax=Geospiza fortis TaxID=48883 RepID=A0A8N5F7A7_GEOFO
ARRPRPQQFFGLMGKRDAGYGQISHKSKNKTTTEEMHHTDAGYTKTLPSCAFARISRNHNGREIRFVLLVAIGFPLYFKNPQNQRSI